MNTTESITLGALAIIETVAREGGFSSAGRRLGLPRASISRTVARTEQQLGVRLFRRTTRKVVPTAAGEVLIQGIAPALAELQAAMDDARAGTDQVSGPVRLSVSHAFGRHFVLPCLPAFQARHPAVQVEVRLADRLTDLVAEPVDLSIRLGPLPDSSMIARRLGSIEVLLVAAPSLMDSHGIPRDLATLDTLPAIGFRVQGTGEVYPWVLRAEGQQHRLVPKRMIMLADSIEGVADLARDGHGVAALPYYLVAQDLKNRHLRQLLPEFGLPLVDAHLCFAEKRLMPRRVRLLIDYLTHELGGALQHG